MKTRIMILIIVLVLCRLLIASDNQEARQLINEIKKCEYGQKFLKDHSQGNLYKIILFSRDPKKYFSSIQDIKDWCAYTEVYDRCLYLRKVEDSWLVTLYSHLQEVDEKTAAILTHLLLNDWNCGAYGEALSTRYTILFAKNPRPFVEDLKKRKNWREVVDQTTRFGEWWYYSAGLSKLGDSGFEKELKDYVREHWSILPNKKGR